MFGGTARFISGKHLIRYIQLRGTYPANQNKYSEYTDLMGERFISGIVMVDNWGYTTAFMSGIADYKPSYNDTITDVDTRYVSSSQSSHPIAWKTVDGSGTPTVAPSAISIDTTVIEVEIMSLTDETRGFENGGGFSGSNLFKLIPKYG